MPNLLLALYRLLWSAARPLIYRMDAMTAHARALGLLTRLDANDAAIRLLSAIHRAAYSAPPVSIGGVELPHPIMLAAGFVKGVGFTGEESALAAVERGENIIPGW